MKAGWEVFRISDIANVTSGNSINAKTKRDEYSGLSEGTPYIATKDVGFDHSIDYDNGVLIPEKNLKSFRVIDRDSVLICAEGGSAGRKVAYLERKAVVVNKLFAVSSKKNVHSKFCFYFFLSRGFQEQFENAKTGLIGGVSKRKFVDFTIPLPPLEEQKRIVAVLDAAFEGLDRARAHVEANLRNARDLFEGYLAKLFTEQGDNWDFRKLTTLCDRITVGFVGPMAHRYEETGVPFLRSQNIRPFQIQLDNVKFIGDEFNEEIRKSKLNPGDVAIVRTGYPGTAAVIPDTLPISNCADLVIATTNEELSPHFLTMFLNSDFGKRLVASKSVGAAQKHFNVGAAKAVDFPTPPILEQKRLVQAASDRRKDCLVLERNYQSKLTDLDDLRQSLLQKAFAGELT